MVCFVLVLDLFELDEGVRAVLVVFAQDRPRLGLEGGWVVGKVFEAIGLDFQHELEVLIGKRRVVIGVIVGRVRVLTRADSSQDLLVLVGRVELRPAEHHVFEEMGEARLARLDLIARAGLHGDLERDEIGKAGRNDDDFQPVGKSLFRGVEREDVAAGRGLG